MGIELNSTSSTAGHNWKNVYNTNILLKQTTKESLWVDEERYNI